MKECRRAQMNYALKQASTAMAEAMLAIGELFVGPIFFTCMIRPAFGLLDGYGFLSDQGVACLTHLFASALTVLGCLIHFSSNLDMGLSDACHQISLFRWGFTRTAFMIVGMQVLGFLIMLCYQSNREHWFMSWKNYMRDDATTLTAIPVIVPIAGPIAPTADPTNGLPPELSELMGALDFMRILDMLVISPFGEEMVFRVIVVTYFYRCLAKTEAALQAKLKASLLAAAMFALAHLLNLVGSDYSITYVLLQVALGFLVGNFYCLRLFVTHNVGECIFLHMMNNFFSSFVPINQGLDLNDPIILLTLSVTVAMYVTLTYRTTRDLKRGDVRHFPFPLYVCS